jgi:hypothetical protein
MVLGADPQAAFQDDISKQIKIASLQILATSPLRNVDSPHLPLFDSNSAKKRTSLTKNEFTQPFFINTGYDSH